MFTSQWNRFVKDFPATSKITSRDALQSEKISQFCISVMCVKSDNKHLFCVQQASERVHLNNFAHGTERRVEKMFTMGLI